MGKPADRVRREATRRLRKMALDAREGAFLGSEADLLERLAVSRPTLRQALRLLEHEQLVQVRMGPLGGCYAARPEVGSVVRAAATYLQARHATLHEMLNVSSMLTIHVIRLAADCTDNAQREGLQNFVSRVEALEGALPQDEFQALEAEFNNHLLAMAANRTLDLFLQVAHRVIDINPHAQVFIEDPGIMRLRRRMWLQLAQALLNRDKALALQLAEQQLDLIVGTIRPDALDNSLVASDSTISAP